VAASILPALPHRRRRWRSRLRKLGSSAENALELIRLGRLSDRAGQPYEVVHVGRHYRLRRYGTGPRNGAPLLLVPPLMMTAEVYDLSPDSSAAGALIAAGIDTFVVDFGAPEHEEGGMRRTLDDHVRSVADAVERVVGLRGRDVHLGGYSQGGMFAYQAAAWRRSAGIASLLAFGAPVDIHQNVPRLGSDITGRLIRTLRPLIEPPLRRLEGLPGALSSTGFRVLSVRKEIGQLVDFVRKLHDRQALEKREGRRRFLAGEGFVAWPGPALMQFIDEFVVHNRMISGGFVLDGQTVTLADIRCPVLCFVGSRDEFARPASVRAIERAAPEAHVHEVLLHAGHFGLVVGSTAMQHTWPAVIDWLAWREEGGPAPRSFERKDGAAAPEREDDEAELEDLAFDEPLDFELFYDTLRGIAGGGWQRLVGGLESAGEALDGLRYQLPRLSRLSSLRDSTRVSFSRTLGRQAKKIPERTFFLWKDRAFSYADANRRVDAVVRGLFECGVRPADRVGVFMHGRPSELSAVSALNRLGAVAVLFSPDLEGSELDRALRLEQLVALVVDPENTLAARAVFTGKVLVLGGGPARKLIEGVVDMEAIDPARIELPADLVVDPGRAADPALVIATLRDGEERAALISNRRWAFSALGAAAACTLRSTDTVYCCLPLHHPSGLLVSVGAAMVGGARLALATRFEPSVFWTEVRRYGASVTFYAGEMCRELVDAPASAAEQSSPLRLFAGSGMRRDVWRKIVDRFGVGVLEFYAPTEGNVVLANASGEKLGAVGRPLPGSAEIALLAWDFEREEFRRDGLGRIMTAEIGLPGVLVARVDARHPLVGGGRQVLSGVFEPEDRWVVSGDVLYRDADGDHYFVDRLSSIIRTDNGPVPTRPLEDMLYELPEVALAAAYGWQLTEGSAATVAAVMLRPGRELDPARLAEHFHELRHMSAPPEFVRVVDRILVTDGYRVRKAPLRASGLVADGRTYRRSGNQGYTPYR
jgi:putative long chain acyl-CoA synthase